MFTGFHVDRWALLITAITVLLLLFALIFTGVLSQKKHGRISLILNIGIMICDVIFLIILINEGPFAVTPIFMIVYGAVSLAAWITDNKVLKIIRTVLVYIGTLLLGYYLVMILLAALLPF